MFLQLNVKVTEEPQKLSDINSQILTGQGSINPNKQLKTCPTGLINTIYKTHEDKELYELYNYIPTSHDNIKDYRTIRLSFKQITL